MLGGLVWATGVGFARRDKEGKEKDVSAKTSGGSGFSINNAVSELRYVLGVSLIRPTHLN